MDQETHLQLDMFLLDSNDHLHGILCPECRVYLRTLRGYRTGTGHSFGLIDYRIYSGNACREGTRGAEPCSKDPAFYRLLLTVEHGREPGSQPAYRYRCCNKG